jgi:hypothetical protein
MAAVKVINDCANIFFSSKNLLARKLTFIMLNINIFYLDHSILFHD